MGNIKLFFISILPSINQINIYQKLILFFLVGIFAYYLFSLSIYIFKKNFKEKLNFKNRDKLLKNIKTLFIYCLLLIFTTYLEHIFVLNKISKFIYSIIIILTSVPIKNIVDITIELLRKKVASKTESNIDDIIFDLLGKFTGAIVFSFTIVIVLDLVGINILPIIAGAGIFGIAIGFAAKDTLSNLIAGVLLMIVRPFEVGHWISVWDTSSGSSWGEVLDIGIRATKIKTADNIIIIIPNNEIMTRDITNYSINSPEIRIKINVGVAYNTEIKKASDIMIKIANELKTTMQNPSPEVLTMNFGESSIDLQLRVWIYNSYRRVSIKSDLMNKIKEEFDKNGIEIPFPQRDVNMRALHN